MNQAHAQSPRPHRYSVAVGSHYEGKKEYKKGDILTTHVDMVALFPGKFTDLGPEEPPAPQPQPSVTEQGTRRTAARA